MDFLHSQQLTRLDGYYHRFMTAGTFRWGIGSLGAYTITVTPPRNPPTPEGASIDLQYDEASGLYVTTQTSININQEDYVLWHVETHAPGAPPFSIIGTDFNSRELADEDAFSHFFMLPGVYKYSVSGGGSQQGSIRVIQPMQADLPRTAQAHLVEISDRTSPNPETLAIIAGDTVHWDIICGTDLVIKSV